MYDVTMEARDALAGSQASCYVTIDSDRYHFMQMTEFSATYKPNVVEVPILGRPNKGHKMAVQVNFLAKRITTSLLYAG